MDWSLRDLRFFVAAAEEGSFTDAARAVGVSQAAVSRTIAGLEAEVGDRLLVRMPHGCELTNVGRQVLPQARRVLAEADRFTEFVASRHRILRLGYAWAALGRHTPTLQRRWETDHPDTDLVLLRHNSPTSGLAEGLCDVAITRRPIDDARFDSVVVGLERRLVAFASDDPLWSRRRQIRMDEIAERTVIIDPRVGNTTIDLWDADHTPATIESVDVDGWLDIIAAGRGVGTTAEATAHHHQRVGVTYRPVKGGPPVPVRLAWWRGQHPQGLSALVDAVTRLYRAS